MGAVQGVVVTFLVAFRSLVASKEKGKEYEYLNEALMKEFWEFILMEGIYKKYSNQRDAFPLFLDRSTSFTEQQTKQFITTPRLSTIADREQELALQSYLDKMSELLLAKQLRTSAVDDEVRKIARVRTLTILRGLDGLRKGSVVAFLYEADLITKNKPIIDLTDADLLGAELSRSILNNIDLSGANLSKANLSEAHLEDASLQGANFTRANLSGTSLKNADLRGASLLGASLRDADLREANLREAKLQGADLSRTILNGAEITDIQLDSTASNKSV